MLTSVSTRTISDSYQNCGPSLSSWLGWVEDIAGDLSVMELRPGFGWALVKFIFSEDVCLKVSNPTCLNQDSKLNDMFLVKR